MSSAAPVRSEERILAIDVLRGFALLGILLMNVQSFSMVSAAYFNPNASGYFEGADRAIWVVVHVLSDQKFMTLFSVLFGAGITLMSGRASKSGASPVALHYRRTFWLLVIGAIHAYLMWMGDVLVWYALCALVVYWFRNVRPKWQLAAGLASLALGSLISLAGGLSIPQMPEDARQALLQDWEPDVETVAQEVEAYRGGLTDQLEHRIPAAIGMHTVAFLFFAAWRAGGLMLVGMALFQWGVLSAARSPAFYRRAVLAGFGLGLPLVVYGVAWNDRAGWSLEASRFQGMQFNYWGSLLVSFGYLGVVMLLCQSDAFEGAKRRLAAVGRMALTNYLLQTVLGTFVFYGHGLGWFQSTARPGQMAVVFAIWALQLVASPMWLERFRFGPAEWVWRSLTYWKLQPFRL